MPLLLARQPPSQLGLWASFPGGRSKWAWPSAFLAQGGQVAQAQASPSRIPKESVFLLGLEPGWGGNFRAVSALLEEAEPPEPTGPGQLPREEHMPLTLTAAGFSSGRIKAAGSQE